MGRFDKIFEKGGKGKMGEEKKKFVVPKIERIEIEPRVAKKPIFKPKEKVSDECLAALRASSEVIGERCGEKGSDECLATLRASSEVIGEKCKFTPPAKKEKTCWRVIDAITAIIDTFVIDNTLKLSIEDHGGDVIKMQPENEEFTCFGVGRSYIGPNTWVEDPYQIRSEADFDFIRREFKRAIGAQKENLIKEANMLIKPYHLKITDFKIRGDLGFESFSETGFREGEIIYGLEVKVGQRKGEKR